MSRMLSSRFGRMAGIVVPVAVVGAIATGVVPAYADDITPPSLVGLSIVGQNGSTPYTADVTKIGRAHV